MLGLLAALAVLAPAWVFGTAPVGASDSHPGGVSEMCPGVLKGSPTDGLKKETEPPDGTEVQGGDVIKVKLKWDETHFDGPKLHKALDCVTLDGDLAPDLSVEERDTANDGEFEHSYTVPKGLPEGTKVCDRGFISGPGRDTDRFYRKKSNTVCFPVAGPTAGESAPTPPPSPPTPPPSPPTPPPPVEQPPAPPPISAGPAGGPVPPRMSAETPAPAAGQAVQPRPQPAATLPRTGSDTHVLVLFAAGALLSGALSVVARGPRSASRLNRN